MAVSTSTVSKGPRCDFCSHPEPEWVYPAYDFEMQPYNWGSAGGWTACEECADLIERSQWEQLVRTRMLNVHLPRAMADAGLTRLTRSERQEVEDQVWRMLHAFRRSRKGARMGFG